MIALLQYLPIVGLLALANLAERKEWCRWLTYALLVLANLGLLAGALLAFGTHILVGQIPSEDTSVELAGYLGAFPVGLNQLGLAFLLMAFFAFLFLLPPIRRLFSRWIPMDPTSCLDCTGLVLVVYYVGLTWAQVALLGGVESLGSIEMVIPIDAILFNGLALAALALVGVGWVTRRSLGQTLSRLKIEVPSRKHWLLALGAILVFVALEVAVSAVWSAWDPEGYELVSKAAEGLYGSLSAPLSALALALATGIGEEALFRGALQPRFGIWLTSLVFALGHLQYGLSPAMLQVFLLSLGLGLMRERANTTTCMIVHGAYNLAGLLLMSGSP